MYNIHISVERRQKNIKRIGNINERFDLTYYRNRAPNTYNWLSCRGEIVV